jgi:hypothetical protein
MAQNGERREPVSTSKRKKSPHSGSLSHAAHTRCISATLSRRVLTRSWCRDTSRAGLSAHLPDFAMREHELKRLVKSVCEFFKSFEGLNFKDLSAAHIQKTIDSHNLSVPELLTRYSKKLRNT